MGEHGEGVGAADETAKLRGGVSEMSFPNPSAIIDHPVDLNRSE